MPRQRVRRGYLGPFRVHSTYSFTSATSKASKVAGTPGVIIGCTCSKRRVRRGYLGPFRAHLTYSFARATSKARKVKSIVAVSIHIGLSWLLTAASLNKFLCGPCLGASTAQVSTVASVFAPASVLHRASVVSAIFGCTAERCRLKVHPVCHARRDALTHKSKPWELEMSPDFQACICLVLLSLALSSFPPSPTTAMKPKAGCCTISPSCSPQSPKSKTSCSLARGPPNKSLSSIP